MEGFTIEGWDDFVENFSKFVDKWADKKKILLQRMANIYHGEGYTSCASRYLTVSR